MPCACLIWLALLFKAHGLGNRGVDWWLGSYKEAYVQQNARFIAARSNVVTGVFHCCSGPTVDASGALVISNITKQLFADLTRTEVQQGLSPMLPLSPDPAAIQSGAAKKAVSALVALTSQIGFQGYVVDYEPHESTTKEHAQAFASFLGALADKLHASGKLLAVCISDWGILNYYSILASAKADRYVSMGSTYKQMPVTTRFNVERMLQAFPKDTITVGIGTMVPKACQCVFGNTGNCTGDYQWTSDSLSSFVSWLALQGVQRLAMWRADIYPSYCADAKGNDIGVDEWTFPILTGFLQNSSSSALSLI